MRILGPVKDPRYLTPAEFRIMEQLWEADSRLSVGQVRERLRRRRKLAYTTVMTLLDKMARKRSVERVKRGRAYRYRAAVSRPEVLRYLVEEFSDSYWGGEPERIVRFLESPAEEKRTDPAPAPEPELDVALL